MKGVEQFWDGRRVWLGPAAAKLLGTEGWEEAGVRQFVRMHVGSNAGFSRLLHGYVAMVVVSASEGILVLDEEDDARPLLARKPLPSETLRIWRTAAETGARLRPKKESVFECILQLLDEVERLSVAHACGDELTEREAS